MKISVIVPVYNVEAYLPECIRSVLEQSMSDFEMILVDDGSTDGCPAICDAAAEQDDRVRVIHQKNGGLSRARNAGLDAARGEWIGFVDSDDCIHPDMYEKLLAAAEKNDADMAICNILRVMFSVFRLKSRDSRCRTASSAEKRYCQGFGRFLFIWPTIEFIGNTFSRTSASRREN